MTPPAWSLLPHNNQRYTSLIETIPVLVVRMDADGNVRYADADTGTFAGYTVEHIVGRPFWLEAAHPEDGWKLTEALRRVVEEQARTTVSVRFQTPNHDLRLAWLHLLPTTPHAPDEIEAIIFDVTEQTEIEAVLLQSEAFYRAFLEQSPMGILHLDAAGVVTFENHAFRQIVGEGVNDAWIGRRIADIPGLDPHLMPLLKRMLHQGTFLRGEAISYQRAGQPDPTYLIVHGSPIRQPGDDIVGGVMMVEDVTEQHQRTAELQLRGRYEQAQTALREAVLADLNEIVFLHEAAAILGQTARADRIHLLIHLGDEGNCATRAVWVNNNDDEPFSLYVDSGAYPALRAAVVHDTSLHLCAPRIATDVRDLFDLTEAEETIWIPFFDNGRLGGFVLFERLQPVHTQASPYWKPAERHLIERLVRLFEALWSWIQVGQRYRLTVTTIEDCLFTFSFTPENTRHYLFLTPQIKMLTGYEPEEILTPDDAGWSWTETLVYPDDRELVHTHNQTLRNGHESHASFRVQHRNGVLHWLTEHATPHRDASGRFTISGILTDITEQKNAEEVLLSAREQVASASRLKSTFVSTMSHELRTPLGAVNGFAELLLDELTEWEGKTGHTLPAPVHEFAEAIRQNAKRLLMLADDLLVLSNMEIGALQVEQSTVFVHRIVERAIANIADLLAQNGLALHVELDAGDPVVRGDAHRIEQILNNLLSNAAKFTESGSVSVRTRQLDGEVRVEVADTGVGIGQEYLSRLFTPFLQEDHRLNRNYGGTGLSLALAKRLLDVMGGRIEVESEKGKGSTFRVYLPLQPQMNADKHG